MKKIYRIIVDPYIMDTYSVGYELNQEIMSSGKWKNWEVENSWNNTSETLPLTSFYSPVLIHNPNTPLTDILDIYNFPQRGLVISSKLLEIFKKQCLPKYIIYPIEINYKDEIILYHYMFFVEDFIKHIDYSQTLFTVNIDFKGKNDQLITFDFWMNSVSTQTTIFIYGVKSPNKVILNQFNHDIFSLDRLKLGYIYISEKMKNILQEKIFGVIFIECSDILFTDITKASS